MLKLLIADDEPKIRRGLADALDWEGMGIEIAGFAGNGVEMLHKVEQQKPDLCLVDINMPLLNGLELIEKLRETDDNVVCIVITGYDEFEYAQRAVRLGVFDYILKPVVDETLRATVEKALQFIAERNKREGQMAFAQQMLLRNLPALQERFLNDLVNGVLTAQEIFEQLTFHKMELHGLLGIAMLKIEEDIIAQNKSAEWDRQLLRFAVRNVFEESLTKCGECYSALDTRENLFALVGIKDLQAFNEVKAGVETYIEQNLSHRVRVSAVVLETFDDIVGAYEQLTEHLEEESSPIIALSRRVIDRNYMRPDFSLQNLAEEINISSGHLSRLFKQETGMTFIDYLTRVRIQEAISLLNDPGLRIYDIAEKVGYGSQHYFCAAFKRVLGVSPTEYRQRKR